MRAPIAAALVAGALIAPSTASAQVGVGHSGWAWASPAPQGNDLAAVAFAGPRGYAAGEFGTLLRTDDAGATWSAVATGLTTRLSELAVLGPDVLVTGGGCTLRRSDDAGKTLRPLRFAPSERGCDQPLVAISFPTADAGVLALDGGTILTTDDGGRTFSRRTGLPGVTDVAFANASTGFATLAGGAILRTADGGRTWDTVHQPGGRLSSVAIAPGGALFAAGPGGLLRSTDGGASWEPMPLDGHAAGLRDVTCAAGGDCLLVTLDGSVLRADGGGATAALAAAGDGFRAAAFSDAGRAVAVGAGGASARSVDGGRSFARQGGRLGGVYTGLRRSSARTAVALGLGGDFARTTDGGVTWSAGSVPTSVGVADLRFATASSAYALDTDGTLLRTDNAGASWRILDPGAGGRASAVLPLRRGVVLLAGPRGVRRSNDGGEAFDPAGGRALRRAVLDRLQPAGSAVLAAGRRSIWRSVDGGRRWRRLRLPSRRTVIDTVDFVSRRAGFVLDSRGRVFRTVSGGRRWRRVTGHAGIRVAGLDFATARRGWMVPARLPGPTAAGWLLRTDDGGRSFRPQLVSRTRLAIEGSATANLVALGSRSAVVMGDGRGMSEDDYDPRPILREAPLFVARGTGDASRRARLTLRFRGGRLAGRLSPASPGDAVTVWRRGRGGAWRAATVRPESSGRFSLAAGRTTRAAVAHFGGDGDRSGAGSRVARRRVR